MPIRIRPAAQTADKYAANSAANVGSYKDGVQNPRREWAAATSAANDTYKTATQAAIAEDRFARGITAEAGAKQKSNAVTLGSARYPQGTSAAKSEWAKETQPILDAMAAVPDMPRGVKGSEQNFQKQRAYANAAQAAAKK
jgi:hypothetical protein